VSVLLEVQRTQFSSGLAVCDYWVSDNSDPDAPRFRVQNVSLIDGALQVEALDPIDVPVLKQVASFSPVNEVPRFFYEGRGKVVVSELPARHIDVPDPGELDQSDAG
jgi:hypothetical protein